MKCHVPVKPRPILARNCYNLYCSVSVVGGGGRGGGGGYVFYISLGVSMDLSISKQPPITRELFQLSILLAQDIKTVVKASDWQFSSLGKQKHSLLLSFWMKS